MELTGASETIERYRQALKHILLMLVVMAEMRFGRLLSLVLGKAAVAPRRGRAGRMGGTSNRRRLPAAPPLPRHSSDLAPGRILRAAADHRGLRKATW